MCSSVHDLTTYPFSVGLDTSMTVVFLEPCGINTPHIHPRGCRVPYPRRGLQPQIRQCTRERAREAWREPGDRQHAEQVRSDRVLPGQHALGFQRCRTLRVSADNSGVGLTGRCITSQFGDISSTR
jgi:hypothetical protein